MPLTDNKKYTADEFFELIGETNQSYELMNGEVVAQAAPSILHQRISKRVTAKLDAFILSKGGKCEVFSAPTDVQIDENNVVQPDIFIGCDPDKFDEHKFNGAPDFVIEIVSSNRSDDFTKKLELYKNCGVREYWIIDPENERTVVYQFGEKLSVNIYTFDKPVPVGIYGGEVTVTVSELI